MIWIHTWILYLFSTKHEQEYKAEDMEKEKNNKKRKTTNISREETNNDEKVVALTENKRRLTLNNWSQI